jgi:hypothetical protein
VKKPLRGTFVQTRELLNQPLESADRDHPGRFDHQHQCVDDRVLIGTLSRGLMESTTASEDGADAPMVYFVNASSATRTASSGSARAPKKKSRARRRATRPPSETTETPTVQSWR